MAIIKSSNTHDHLTIDGTSNAARATLYNSNGREISQRRAPTFMASGGEFSPGTSLTSFIQIPGSPSHTVRVSSFIINTTTNNQNSFQFQLIKRLGGTVGGTSVQVAGVPMDYPNSTPTTAVSHFTVIPTTVGNSAGVINTVKVHSSNQVPGTTATAAAANKDGVEMLPRIGGQLMPITLHGPGEVLELSGDGGALIAGQLHTYRVVWTEEDS